MNRHYRRVVLRVGIGTLLAVMGPVGALLATSDSWDGSTDALWSTTTNWLADPAVVPGTGDIATFNSAGNGNTTIDLGAGVTIGTILFDTVNATAYTIGAGAVNGQTLTLDNGGAITANASVIANQLFNAAIVLGNDGTAQSFTFTNNSTTGTLTFAGGITGSTGAGVKTLTLTGAGNTAISGAISNGTTGTVALIKSGAGTLTLSGAKTYSGGTTITAGVLSISAANNLGTGATLLDGGTLRSTGAANVDINTATAITVGASGGTINSVHTGGTFRFQQANSLLGSGALTITGNGTLPLAGNHFSGIVVLNAANTYNGNVTLQDGGLLEVANAGGLATGATVTVGSNGGLSLAGVNFARAVTVNTGGTLLFQNNNNGVFSGPITLNGATTIRMQDWYGGTVRNGTITSTITDAQTITVNSGTNAGTGGTLTLGGFDAKASSADIILNSASLAMNSNSGTAAPSVMRANSLTINTGNLNVAGVASQNTNDVFGTLNLGGGSTTTSTAGVLQGFSTWAFTPNAATNTALTFTNMGTRTAGSWVAISGAIGATPGAGTANIFFTNAPSGSNLIGVGGSLASGTASVIPWLRDQGGGNIYGYDATNGVVPVTTVGVDLNAATAGQNISDGGSTLTANRTINSLQATFGNYDLGGNTLTVTSGVITADNASFFNGTLDFGTAEGQMSVHQVRQLNLDLPITGSGGLTFVGFRTNSGNAGRLRLGGANTYTGVTNFYGYGAATADFYITNSLALQNTTVNYVAGRGSTLFFGNGGTSGQTAYTFGGLTGNANINLNNNNTTVGAVALTLGSAGSADTAATVNTYSGVLSNTVAGGSVIKDGVATQVLTGANTYSGGTTITNGDLRLGNTAGSATGTGEVFVSGGISATLSGTGIATGLTTVTGGSRLAPGNNTSGNFGIGGTLRAGTTGGLTLTDAHLDFDLQTTAASATDDLINTAALSLGSTIAFTFNGLGGSLETGAAYTLIGAGSISGFDENNISTAFLGALSGFYTAAYSVNGSDLQVTFSAIPEPGSAVSLLGGLGVLVGLQRFRRRQRAEA